MDSSYRDARYKEWFDRVDADKNGQLDCSELQKSLALSNLKFSLVTIGQLIRVHDRTNTGTITLEEFKDLHRFLRAATKTFRQLDVDKKGSLTYDEVWTAIQIAGISMDRNRAFQRMVISFDPQRKRSLDLAEFIRLKLYIQCAISTFHAFNSDNTGKVTLSCNQFLYAAANVL
ncbi:hypothetical protein BSKO_10604 [Bryopsis sp. KO-2023]|nr:hypothetical protein BSKO_10604 [Bryopsis sp. KO-2023]